MKKMSTVKAASTCLAVLSFAIAFRAFAADAPQTPDAGSNVRIVRLSEVRGTVQVDRAIGRGFEPAITNLPIVEQSRVRTGTGVAEVEFEDNSTLRIGPDSLVEFPQLGRTATGATASTVHLVQGTAYVSLMKSHTDLFTLVFGNRSLALPPAAHIRLEIAGDQAKLAVLGGAIPIDESRGAVEVPKKKTVTFDLRDQNEPTIAKNIVAGSLDEWDKQSVEYHARAAGFGAFNSPYAYGLSDMAYYGAFNMSPGCGRMWRPYFASAAWDPYSNGAWAWYSNSGYSWVSPYPWGWTPYHSGSWAFCPSTGWGWIPGRSWSGLQNGTGIVSPKQNPTRKPIFPPARPPRHDGPTIFVANTKPIVRSGIASPTSFRFRGDSAGLGIPRQTLGRLNRFSEHAVAHGVANTQIYLAAPAGGALAPARGGVNRGAGAVVITGATIHRGSAPSAPMQSGSGSSGGMGGGSPSAGRISSPSMSSHVSAPSSHASAPSAGGGGSRR